VNGQDLLARALVWLDGAAEVAMGWLASPAAWSQAALLAAALALALLAARRLRPLLLRLLTPPAGQDHALAQLRRFLLSLVPLLFPLLAYGLTALGEEATRAMFGAGGVIGFGKRLILLLAARILVRDVLRDPFLRILGRYVLVPVAALNLLGLLAPLTARMAETTVDLGNISFSVLTLFRGGIAGSLLFWAGSWSNRQSSDYIKRQTDLRPATRELATKAAEVAIFGAAFLLLMSILGIDLTAVAVIGGALGVGIGLGLQQIAANFVSGIILLLEGQATVGDFVSLDGGEQGRIVQMTARAVVLETFDGRRIMVPNDHFITTRVVNFSDEESPNRYEAHFPAVAEADPERVIALAEAAVRALPFVRAEPAAAGEIARFGPRGPEYVVKFWAMGLDDGDNSYMGPALMAIWQALRAEGIAMPFRRDDA
jgi:small-conductance mechanosensitive channel